MGCFMDRPCMTEPACMLLLQQQQLLLMRACVRRAYYKPED
jgi:hypothetical protein